MARTVPTAPPGRRPSFSPTSDPRGLLYRLSPLTPVRPSFSRPLIPGEARPRGPGAGRKRRPIGAAPLAHHGFSSPPGRMARRSFPVGERVRAGTSAPADRVGHNGERHAVLLHGKRARPGTSAPAGSDLPPRPGAWRKLAGHGTVRASLPSLLGAKVLQPDWDGCP